MMLTRVVHALSLAVGLAMATSAMAADDAISKIDSSGKLRVCFAEDNPWTFKNPTTGKWEGLTKDMAVDLAAAMEVELVDVDASWSTLIQNLQTDKCDIIGASLFATPKRAKVVLFSDPFAYETTTAFVHKDSPLKSYAELDVAGKTVGVKAGTVPEEFSKRFLTQATTKSYLADSELAIVTDVATKRIDAWWDSTTSTERFLKENPQYPLRAIGDEPKTPVRVVWAVGSGQYGLQQLINTWLYGYLSSGKMEANWAKWFGTPYVTVK
ncbi:ABC transporter substrate-binding protein [Ancylobacter sp. A5.8]|uniref:substrate-binding periplasmic protein n=1 Tax=Ancylobacter gelatini TaxID=2919920 RepID=UPI001F4EA70E|nr:ABC transporter substrate-binding protein [Ancylobacter gelatini]MCJ8142855.1 ABC transporter substrate-binding protein [Ancylobacter gelatini]